MAIHGQVQNELLSRWHALSAEYELLEGRLLYFADQRNENVIRISERQKDGLEELEDRERKPVGVCASFLHFVVNGSISCCPAV